MDFPKTMKAAVLHGPKDLRFEDLPLPKPKENEVLLKILANGLCGSDIHFFEKGELGPFRVTKPYVPGHEAVGEVVVPDAKGRRKAGAIVVIEPGIPCGVCEHCRSGRYNLCPDVVFLSAPPVNGTFSEYAAVQADMTYPLPEGVGVEEGALVEPLSVGLQACNRAGLKAGQTVVITGSGPIGLITLLVARSLGASKVIMTDIQKNRLEKALELGAFAIVDAGKEDAIQAVSELTGGRFADVVIDTSGSSVSAAAVPLLAKRGGTAVLVGWPEKPTFPFPVEQIIERELDVRGVNRYCNTFAPVLSLMASGSLKTSALVSHRFPLEKVCEAFDFASRNRNTCVKVLVKN